MLWNLITMPYIVMKLGGREQIHFQFPEKITCMLILKDIFGNITKIGFFKADQIAYWNFAQTNINRP